MLLIEDEEADLTRIVNHFLKGVNLFPLFRRLVTPFLVEVNDSQRNS